jgi:mono/diheme cytochrome c family protein
METRAAGSFGALAAVTAAFLVALGCGSPTPAPAPKQGEPSPVVTKTEPRPAVVPVAVEETSEEPLAGDAKRGESLVARFECVRCHDGTGQPAPFIDHQCKGCHERVVLGTLPFPKERLDQWRASLRHYTTTPDLAQAGRTLRPSWIAAFLREPTKVRPHMEEWMPRLDISERDAADIAVYLTASTDEPSAGTPVGEIAGDAERGKALAASRGCFACHEFTGAARGEGAATIPALSQQELGAQIVRAPDLRFVRDRFRPDVLTSWIVDPSRIKKGALMPALGLTENEARDIAAYLMTAKLDALPPPKAPFERLPLLDRPVGYEEVSNRVFKKSCIHCHADPDPKGGDPGPGNTGGLGFAPRGVRLTSYAGLKLGYIGKGGARHSSLAEERSLEKWGGSRLVAALVARHEETSGRPVEEVRGMPLGLPSLSAEDIQLVESWVAQGAPFQARPQP